mmetsp:Transcript_4048/g.4961  ORF Transcript_4048/g.4961 Transcript_4048/m.4961 type:complete len:439 (+) Transcript_4048:278-1594(+)
MDSGKANLLDVLVTPHGTNVLEFLSCRDLSALELTCKALVDFHPTTSFERCRRKCLFRQFHEYLMKTTSLCYKKKKEISTLLQKYYRPRFNTSCPLRRKRKCVADIEELVDRILPLFEDRKEIRSFLGVAHYMTSRCVKEAFLRKFLKQDAAERERIKAFLWEDLIFRKADIGTVNYLLRRNDECDRICCVRALSQIMSRQNSASQTRNLISRIYDYNVDGEILRQLKGCTCSTYNFYTDTCFGFFRELYCSERSSTLVNSFVSEIDPFIAQFKCIWSQVPNCKNTRKFARNVLTLSEYREAELRCYEEVFARWQRSLVAFSQWIEDAETHKHKLLFYANYVIFNASSSSELSLECIVLSIYLLKHFDGAKHTHMKNFGEKETFETLYDYYKELDLYKEFTQQMGIWTFRQHHTRPWVYDSVDCFGDKSPGHNVHVIR